VESEGKVCTKCNVWKLPFHFPKNGKGLHSQCKECKKAYRKRWGKDTGYDSYYYNENKERLKSNALLWKSINKERDKEGKRNWRKRNQEKVRVRDQNKAARKALLKNTWTESQKNETWRYFNNACALTGIAFNLHADHVIPLAVGHGGTIFENMIPLYGRLNESKNNRNIFEWFEANRQRFELSQKRFDKLIEWLASANAMTVDQYRDYVYWCHANPRSLDELKNEGKEAAI
jgi:hypothetical protein